MGVNLKDLLIRAEIGLSDLGGKKVAVDANNTVMQFLSTIRLPTGEPLRDSKGSITSHLSGLFYRNLNLLKAGVRPVYVFDGPEKPFKERVIAERIERRKQAEAKYAAALAEGRHEEASSYATQTARLTPDLISESKELLAALGIPWVQAPSEAEAQCAHLARKKDVYATVSQDFDSLLFGTPILIRNLNVAGRRKLPKKKIYVQVKPELIDLDENLRTLGVTRAQLIIIALLVGTDYNPGIKGIGPKKALALVKSKKTLRNVLAEVAWDYDIPAESILQLFLNPRVEESYKLSWSGIDEEKVIDLMVNKHEFALERIKSQLSPEKEKNTKGASHRDQTGLGKFI
jgi:flap endonuclease-1